MSVLADRIVTHILGLRLPGGLLYLISELSLMVATMVHVRPNLVFEWGTNAGCSTRIFFEAAEMQGLKTRIHSTDLPPHLLPSIHANLSPDCEGTGKHVAGNRYQETFSLHLGDGLDVSLSIWEQEGWSAARVLWFLDGDHSEKAVRR